jgi:hypothetical protein
MHKRGYAWSTAQSRGAGAETIALEAFVATYRTGTPTATTRLLPDVDARTPKAPVGPLRATLAARSHSPRCTLQPLRFPLRSPREGTRRGQGAANATDLRGKACNLG